jgi:hypothetical protein
MALFKDFVVKQGLQVEGTLQSSSTATGSLIVGGGAGIGKDVFIGGSIKRIGDVVGTNHNLGAQLTLSDATFTDSITSGRTAWGVVNYFGQSVLDTISENATYTNAASLFIKGAPASGENLTIEKAWSVYITSGTVFIGETSGSTSTAAGQALQVAGGISFGNGMYGSGGGSLFGPFFLNNSEILTRATVNVGLAEFPDGILVSTSTQAVSTDTGAIIVSNGGGVGVSGNVYVGGYLAVLTTGTFLGTENSLSTSSGALTVAGGLGIGQDLFARNATFVSGLSSTSTVGGNSLRVSEGGGLGVSGDARIEGQVWLSNSVDSAGQYTGALVVEGGASIGRNLTVDTVVVVNDTVATDSTTAPFIVAGGVGIAKNLIVGDVGSSTGTAASNALVVAGGGYFGGDLTVDGTAVIKGSFYLLGTGTQVTINSTSTYIVDPVIEIGGGADGAMLTIPDVYDKGLLIHYQNAVSTVTDFRAFFGLENTTERFIFKQDILPGVSGEDPFGNFYNSGTWSTLEAGSLILRDTSESTDNLTGTLIVAGGAYFGNNSVFASTVTNTAEYWNIDGIENNSIQVPNGGIGAKYLYVADQGWINGAQILTTGTVNAGIGGEFTNTFYFSNLTESNSTDSGAVIINGGLGVGKNVNIGGNVTTTGTVAIYSDTESNSTDTGALTVVGGVGIGKNVNIGGRVTINDTTPSTTTDTGALVVNGGAGVAGDLNVGGLVSVINTLTVEQLRVLSLEDSVDKETGAVTISGGLGVGKTINATHVRADIITATSGSNAISTTTGDLVVAGGAGIGQDVYIGGAVKIQSTVTSVGTDTGALVVDGGVGIVKDVFVAGTITRNGTVTKNQLDANGSGLSLSASTYVDLASIGSNAGTVAIHNIGQPTIIGSLLPNWDNAATLKIDNAPSFDGGATATRAWALYVANGNVRINATTVNDGTTATGALQVAGGVGIGGNLAVGGEYLKTQSVVIGTGAVSDSNRITSVRVVGKTTDTPVLIDSYVGNQFTTAKYLVQVTDLGTPNKFHVVELMVTYDGSATQEGVYISQYGIITNTGELGSFDIAYSAGDIQIVFAPNYTPVSMNIRALRMAIVT